MKKLFMYPSKNLVITIPIALVFGFLTGLWADTTFLKDYILVMTFLMIYPTMIGFKIREAFDFSYMKTVLISLLVNFLLIPGFAYLAGRLFLQENPDLFVGLVMISLFPTSAMTISWTMLNKGNVAAAIKITSLSLLLGSFLAPWYLYAMVGKLVAVNLVQTFITILLVVVLPMIAGAVTYRFLMSKFSLEKFNAKIKPLFPAISVWFLMFLIFASISMKAKSMMTNPGFLLRSALVLAVFYAFNFLFSTLVARFTLPAGDGFALLYGTVMRNLSVALGIAVSAFGAETALVVTLAFIIQVQGAAWYGRLAPRFGWLEGRGVFKACTEVPGKRGNS